MPRCSIEQYMTPMLSMRRTTLHYKMRNNCVQGLSALRVRCACTM